MSLGDGFMHDEFNPLPPAIEDALADLLFRNAKTRESGLANLLSLHPEHAAAIQQRVDALNAEHRLSEAPLSAGVGDTNIPEQIGPYRILKPLGEGGMGIVFLAEQERPIRRLVALKVVKLGMDSSSVLSRFEAERQALAMMNHDNIAKVFDVGTTKNGQPYFAMEHVPGLPFIEYCEQHRTSTKERLVVFLQICDGVQHAHQKGVIHRDLKPSNVLVSENQGRPVPKIIDFGIAKAVDQQLSDATLLTQQGVLIGTPAYASPEQADLTTTDIDTRTDVYSLGVMLYELLTGHLPFTTETPHRAGLLELLRAIREDDPIKPSTQLRTSNENWTSIAAQQSTTSSGLLRALRGDLDWIVLKALEKERHRRYDSPNALAADVRRYLAHEPVLAGPPTSSYRLRKFVRRYRGRLLAASAVLAALIVGTVTSIIFALTASNRANEITVKNQKLSEQAERIQVRTDDFNMLANSVSLSKAKASETELYPARPDKVVAMSEWLNDDWARVDEARVHLKATLAKLRSHGERLPEPVTSPEIKDLAKLTGLLASVQRRDHIRSGEEMALEHELQGDVKERSWQVLTERALPLVHINREIFGREAEGLSLARLAWSKSEEEGLIAGYALAYGLLTNGLESEAASLARELLSPLLEHELGHLAWDVDWISKTATASEEDRQERRRNLNDILEELRIAVVPEPQWHFEDQAEQFLHDTLSIIAEQIDAFENEQVAGVRKRLTWAQRVDELSIGIHKERWREAREAILAADDERASSLYANRPLDLAPQMGLVPIGKNPKTGLWEFYHLRSAADPSQIPMHAEDGSIAIDDGTGLVFVLIPGGSFYMGAQTMDAKLPNFDPQAVGNEFPVHELTLRPYFMSRYEMTKAQWRRVTGDDPSYFNVGVIMTGNPEPVGGSHPIESVSWETCDVVLSQQGLAIPTEAQWEYACRAGTKTPWYTGKRSASLEGQANLMDRTAASTVPSWGSGEPMDDKYTSIAPVGSFAPNPFGLHEVIGNVEEWCRDYYAFYHYGLEDPDGIRAALGFESQTGARITRGGSYRDVSSSLRTTVRARRSPQQHPQELGVRPSRAVAD